MSDNLLTGTSSTRINRQLIRYAAGSLLITMIAIGSDYTLSFLTPVLALNFLGPNSKMPGLKSSFVFLLSVAATIVSGLIFSIFLLEYPVVFLPVILLTVFHLYYTTSMRPVVRLVKKLIRCR